MPVPKNVLINFLGAAWAGASIILSTPVFVRQLGFEGFGLIGFWQVLIYLSMVADLGLGAAFARELARCDGRQDGGESRRALLRLFERPVLVIAGIMAIALFLASGFMAQTWLSFSSIRSDDVERALHWLALSVAGQFLFGFYANALGGMQRMGSMNALQAMNNGLRFLGGAGVATYTRDITTFFAFQAVTGIGSAALTRTVLSRAMGPGDGRHVDVGPLRQFVLFSGGMFFTAMCGVLMSHADRLAVSKLLDAESLGRYSVALTATGLLQMLVFAFHRAFYPRFAQLNASGDLVALKKTYVNACVLLGSVLVPSGLVFLAFTPQLFTIWLGRSDPSTEIVSRVLVFASMLSGLIWLPAAYQQAAGRTRLHAGLMAATLLVGLPMLLWSIQRWGLAGATSLMLLHGVIQITVAQWLMNRDALRGEISSWYWGVLLRPALVSSGITAVSLLWLPAGLSRLLLALWIGSTYLAAVALLMAWIRRAPSTADRS